LKSVSWLAIVAVVVSGCNTPVMKSVKDLGVGGKTISIGYTGYAEDRISYFVSGEGKFGGGRGEDYTGIIGPGGFPGDPFIESENSYYGMSFGGTYLVKKRIGLFVGIGAGLTTEWCTYYDPSHILDLSGYYHVECDSGSEAGLVYGAHVFLNEKWVLGYEKNEALDNALWSIGLSEDF